ncbi:hypothetical protein ACQ0MK_17640 [Thalassospira lucentensis]|uniref:hypothetical protein n=1 Tax=Thalassospira lucentensis TaxID=168935 RepID=UPI003D2EDC0A
MRTSGLIIQTPRTDIIRPFGVLLLLTMIALGLSACGGSTVPPGTTNTSYGQTTNQGNVKTTTTKTTATTRRPATSGTAAKKPKSKTESTVAAIPFKPVPTETLKGLSETDFESKIGAPEMIRAEGDIRVWQYRSEQCSFDAFFVPKAEGDPRELRHMLARMRRGNNTITLQDCLDQVVKLNLGRG